MFFVVLNDQQHSAHFSQEDAYIAAAQLDHMLNSPELNDGVQNFNEADVLMHCIELFVGQTNSSFMDCEMKEVMMDSTQINDLFLRIQESKFADS